MFLSHFPSLWNVVVHLLIFLWNLMVVFWFPLARWNPTNRKETIKHNTIPIKSILWWFLLFLKPGSRLKIKGIKLCFCVRLITPTTCTFFSRTLAPLMSDYLQPGDGPLTIELYQGSVTEREPCTRGFDLVTCVELWVFCTFRKNTIIQLCVK